MKLPMKFLQKIVNNFTIRNYSLKLEPSLRTELEFIRENRNFQAEEWIDEKSSILNDYMSSCGLTAIAINLSGGVDSSVTFALIHDAMNREGSDIERLVGISQPIHSTAKITDRSFLLEKYGEIITVDQTEVFDDLCPLVEEAVGISGELYQQGQLKSYMRTPVVYYVAQLLSMDGYPCVVMGTGNFDEDGYLYYFCKAGDGIADLQIINELHKSEVFQVGYELGLPEEILGAPPSADLWDGQTDEDELGFPYDFVELYTEFLEFDDVEKFEMFNRLDADGLYQFKSWEELINKVHSSNSHKDSYPINLNIERYDLKNKIKDKSEECSDCISTSSSSSSKNETTTTNTNTTNEQQDMVFDPCHDQYCPVCNLRVEPSSLYPDYVCFRCFKKVEDKEGRSLFFSASKKDDTKGLVVEGFYDQEHTEIYHEDTCFIDGVECTFEGGVYGGVVIRKSS